MSKSVNTKFAKCFIIFMATVILVQGVVYVGLAIQGIRMHNCSGENSDPVGKTFEFILNLIYFSSKECGEPRLHIPEHDQYVTLNIDFKKANVLSDREYIFSFCYVIISALWVVTSFLVLVTICFPLTTLVALICFWPWLISILIGSVLDAIATGFHIKDIFQTTSASSTFAYVGVTNTAEALDYFIDYLKDYDIFFAVPAVVFACITSRIVLIWLLNIFGSIFCLSLARVLSSNNKEKMRQPRRPSSADTVLPSDLPNELQEETVAVRFRPSPETVRKVRSTLEPIPNSPVESLPAEPMKPYALPVPVPQQTSSNKNSRVSMPKSNPVEASTYQISDAHPENLDYPPNRYSTPTSQTRSITPELSAISPLNLRYSTVDGAALFPNQPHVSQELRGQLPWSYTNIMNDPIAQKRIQAHLPPDEDEDFPPIPVPDYTLHPPKKDRTPVVGQERLSQTGYSRW